MEAIEAQLAMVAASGVSVESPEPIKIVPPAPKVAPLSADREEEPDEEEREAEALKSMTMAPPPVEPAKVDPGALQAASKPAAVAVAEPPDFGFPGQGPMVVQDKKVSRVRELPGEDLEIVVIVRDPNSSYLKGEAAFKGKSVEEYLQEMIDFGMQSRWFF